jgi:SAM-dependent methyltransferase
MSVYHEYIGGPQADFSLARFAQERLRQRWYTSAFDDYKNTVTDMIKTYGFRNILEVGGGRSPLLSLAEADDLCVKYTVNDISQRELDLAPGWTSKACFDIAGRDAPAGEFDLIFSRMVMEHVRDASQAYKNLFELLAPGGIGLHFHPTLFAPPFVINCLLPDSVSRKVLSIFGHRFTDTIDEYPKFPAYYSWCRNSESVRQKIMAMGFSEVELVDFYGHGYFKKIPGIHQIDASLSRLALKQGLRAFASYAYTLVRR